jgi:hypothetical protein
MFAVLETFANELNLLIGIATTLCAITLGFIALLCTLSGFRLVIVFGVLSFPVVNNLWRNGRWRIHRGLQRQPQGA